MVFVIGARRKDLLLCEMELKASGVDARAATEDGSHGTHGKVTDALAPLLAEREGKPVTVYCCGPTPMMRAVGELCQSLAGVPCQLVGGSLYALRHRRLHGLRFRFGRWPPRSLLRRWPGL